MAWKSVVTNAGRALLTQYAQGGHTLRLTAAHIGSGTVAEANLRSRTAVSNYKDLGVLIDARIDGNAVKYVVQVRPASSAAYVAHQIGIIAVLDNSSTSTLLVLAQDADTGVSVPTQDTSPDFAFELHIALSVDNTEDLSVNVDGTAYVSHDQLAAGLATITPRSINAYGNASLPTPITDADNYDLYGTITLNGATCENLPTDDAYYVMNFMGRTQTATKIDGTQNIVQETWYRCYVNSMWYPWVRIDANTETGLDFTWGADVIRFNGNSSSNFRVAFIPDEIDGETGESLMLVSDGYTMLQFTRGGTARKVITNYPDEWREGIGAAAASHNHSASDINSGTLSASRGGTGQSSLQATRNAMGLGNTTGALPVPNGGTGAENAADARDNLGITPRNISAFGNSSLPSITDANNNTLYGSNFYAANAVANLPTNTSGQYYSLICMGHVQIAIQYTSSGPSKLYARQYTNSQWYPWKGVALS